jgi:hypothetical protein
MLLTGCKPDAKKLQGKPPPLHQEDELRQSLALATNRINDLDLQVEQLKGQVGIKQHGEQALAEEIAAKREYEASVKNYNKIAKGDSGLYDFVKQCSGIVSESMKAAIIENNESVRLGHAGREKREQFISALGTALNSRDQTWAALEKLLRETTETQQGLPITDSLKARIRQHEEIVGLSILESGVENFLENFSSGLSEAGGPNEAQAMLESNSETVAAIDGFNKEAQARGKNSLSIGGDYFKEMTKSASLTKDRYSSQTVRADAGVRSAELGFAAQKRFFSDRTTLLASLEGVDKEITREVILIVGTEEMKFAQPGEDPLPVLAQKVEEAKKRLEKLSEGQR